MKRLLVAFFIFLNYLPLFCGAQNASVPVTNITKDSIGSMLPLQKNWLYKEQDDTAFSQAGYDDSDWYVIKGSTLPVVGKKKYPGDHFNSLAWFRLHFRTDSSLNNIPIALTISQQGASELYLDGKLIRKFGKIAGKESTYYDPGGMPLIVNVPPGDHVLAVRYANYNAARNAEVFESNEVGFSIALYNANNINSAYIGNIKSSVFLITAFLIFFYSFCLLHFIFFIYNRSDKSNLYFSLFCFSFGSFFLMGVLYILSNNPIYSLSATYTFVIALCLVGFSLSGFVNTLFGHSKRRKQILAVLCFAPIAIRPFSLEDSFLAVGLVLAAVSLEAIVLNIKAIYKKVNGAKIVGIGVL